MKILFFLLKSDWQETVKRLRSIITTKRTGEYPNINFKGLFVLMMQLDFDFTD